METQSEIQAAICSKKQARFSGISKLEEVPRSPRVRAWTVAGC